MPFDLKTLFLFRSKGYLRLSFQADAVLRGFG